MRRFYRKSKIVIGNRKNCEIYVKYKKPIYVYTNGIVNPYQQRLKVNGKEIAFSLNTKNGDLIEYGDIYFRTLENEILIGGNYETALIEKINKEIQYNDFLPRYVEYPFLTKSFQIETFNVQKMHHALVMQIYGLIMSGMSSVIMIVFLNAATYMYMLFYMNLIMIIIQVIVLIFSMIKHRHKYLLQQKNYMEYLNGMIESIFSFYEKAKNFEKIYLERSLFAIQQEHPCFLSVALGNLPQQIVTVHYQRQSRWYLSHFDKVVHRLIHQLNQMEVLNVVFLKNKKTLILNNVNLLDVIIAKLIQQHSYEDLKICWVGECIYAGKHFCNVQIDEVKEDHCFYIFSQYHPIVKKMNISCIVLSDEIHCKYDEILEQRNNKVIIHQKDVVITLKEEIDIHEILFNVNQYTLKSFEKINRNVTLLDVHHDLQWNTLDCSNEIIAHITDRVVVDFHEKKDGPHALIVGMTGSGKSELLQAVVTSLCISYHPNQIQFVIIDYKGRSFANQVAVFPHVIGVMDNLNEDLTRCITVLKTEIIQRQKIFNTQSISHIDESTLPHLFIVCDEFAELKKEQPEFIQSLISIARIGRSLGIHLILATQKPSGVISDEILSNANLKMVLKLNDKSESHFLLGNDDACDLKNPGDVIIQSDQQYTICRCMYINGQYIKKNANRICVGDRVINDHQYYPYTQREYFAKKMYHTTVNIFELLPINQSECLFLVDEITKFKKLNFIADNYVIYGDFQTGKTTTLEEIIHCIAEGVVYYIYEDKPVNLRKVVNIELIDIKKITQLIYRLNQPQKNKIFIVIDCFEYMMQYDIFDEIEQLIKNSIKNNIYFIVSSKEELRFQLLPYFKQRFCLHYDTNKRQEITGFRHLMNTEIKGRAWWNKKEVQIGINLEKIDYKIDESFQLNMPQINNFKNCEIGIHQLRLEVVTIQQSVHVFANDEKILERYVCKVQHPKMITHLITSEIEALEFISCLHKIVLDEACITWFGDYNTCLRENEALYIGLRKKEIVIY